MDQKQIRKLLIGEFTFKRMINSLLFIYIFFALYVFFVADRMIFVPQPASYTDDEDILKLSTSNQEKFSGLYLPNPNAQYTLLYSHGNAEDLGEIRPVLEFFQAIGFNVFAYDYRGYGTSEGKASERNTYEEIEIAYTYLTEKIGISPDRILLFGRSVGGGPTLNLATRKPVGGIILESTFTQVFRVVVPFPLLPFDKFRNLDKIKQIKVPVLIVHGMEDNTIPFSHGQKLFAAAPEPKLSFWVEGATHNDLFWVAGDDYAEKLQEFEKLVMRSLQ
ncbi:MULTISPECIES: alpha/beta hydrolase [Spirulina sp. CCY15215]|uniref:alpha/beta hydrolase n=1 Tax=Spirulina sp. CCY15215 TaxID=2767591 RepID=UPI001951F9A3